MRNCIYADQYINNVYKHTFNVQLPFRFKSSAMFSTTLSILLGMLGFSYAYGE